MCLGIELSGTEVGVRAIGTEFPHDVFRSEYAYVRCTSTAISIDLSSAHNPC